MNGQFEYWLNEAKEFNGDVALFWAGRMSICIDNLKKARISEISSDFDLLVLCQEKYDRIIFDRVDP